MYCLKSIDRSQRKRMCASGGGSMYAFEAKRGRAGEGSVQRETYMAERKRNNFMMFAVWAVQRALESFESNGPAPGAKVRVCKIPVTQRK